MGAEIGVTSLPLFVPPSAGGLTSATALSALAQSQRLRVAARASRRPKHRADSARLPLVTADIACTAGRGPAQVGRLSATLLTCLRPCSRPDLAHGRRTHGPRGLHAAGRLGLDLCPQCRRCPRSPAVAARSPRGAGLLRANAAWSPRGRSHSRRVQAAGARSCTAARSPGDPPQQLGHRLAGPRAVVLTPEWALRNLNLYYFSIFNDFHRSIL